jgi:hypothetical protein
MLLRPHRVVTAVLVTAALWLVSSIGLTRPPLECPPAAPPAAAPSTPAMEEARTRYERGQELYDDGAYEQALIEFERAYELAPAYRILFNIGQVAVLLNDYPKAIEALEGYLCGGKGKIPAKRGEAVDRELDTLYGRVAYIEVTTNVDGAEIVIDNTTRGRTPLDKPIMVNAGRHVVLARFPGLIDDKKTVTLAGTDRLTVELKLVEPPPGHSVPVPLPFPQPPDPADPRPTPPAPREKTAWVGWLLTGTLTAGAVVTGLLALNAQSNLETLNTTPNISADEVESKKTEGMALAITTDVLAGLAVVSAGLTIWWTVAESEGDDAASARVVISPTSLGVAGTF